MTRFRFVSANEDAYRVKRLCELVECSRSGFYGWRDRPLSDRYLADVDLANEIYDIHVASRRTYGTPRVLGSSSIVIDVSAVNGSLGSWPNAASSVSTAARSGGVARSPRPPRRRI